MPTTALRDQLADVQERKRDARDRIAAARAEADRARAAFAADTGPADPSSPTFRAAEISATTLRRAERDLALIGEEERELLRQAAGLDGNTYGRDNFLNDPSVLAQLQGMAHSTSPIGRQALGAWCSRDRLAGTLGRMAAAGDVTVSHRRASGRVRRDRGPAHPTAHRPGPADDRHDGPATSCRTRRRPRTRSAAPTPSSRATRSRRRNVVYTDA